MANDPAFLFYPGDYLRDTQCLSEAAQVAYDRIMCEHMRNISSDMSKIGVTQEKHDFFTKRLSEGEKSDLSQVLRKSGDLYQIEWVAISISKRRSYSESRAENRRTKKPEDMKTYDKHMENANENDIVSTTGIWSFDKNQIIPVQTLEAVERNQFTYTKSKNTEFVKSSWETFLLERLNEPKKERVVKYPDLNSLTKYFINWMKERFPKPQIGGNGLTKYEQETKDLVKNYQIKREA